MTSPFEKLPELLQQKPNDEGASSITPEGNISEVGDNQEVKSKRSRLRKRTKNPKKIQNTNHSNGRNKKEGHTHNLSKAERDFVDLYKQDLIDEGYPKDAINFFVEKSLIPIVIAGRSQNLDVMKEHVKRVIHNFHYDQNNKQKQEQSKEDSKPSNKEVLHSIEKEENERMTPAESIEMEVDAWETGYKKHQVKGVHKNGRKKGEAFSYTRWRKRESPDNLSERGEGSEISDSHQNEEHDNHEFSAEKLISEVPSLVEKYREKLRYGEGQIEKDLPRKKALNAVNTIRLMHGKLKKAYENAGQKENVIVHSLMQSIEKQKKIIERYLEESGSNLEYKEPDEAFLHSVQPWVKAAQENTQKKEGDIQIKPDKDELEYTKPDGNFLQGAQPWRQAFSEKLEAEVDAMSRDPREDTFEFRNNASDAKIKKEPAVDNFEGHLTEGEKYYTLLGMSVPKAGSEQVYAARSFREGLRLVADRVPELTEDPEKRKSFNEILFILDNIPDSGLTKEEAQRVYELAKKINIPDSPLRLDVGRTIDQMYAEIDSKVLYEKLPALDTVKKKRGFFGKLAAAVLISLPFMCAKPLNDNHTEGQLRESAGSSESSPGIEQQSTKVVEEITKNKSKEKLNSFYDSIDEEIQDVIDDIPIDTDEVFFDPKSPAYQEELSTTEAVPVTFEYTFSPESKTNTISGAIFETWKKHPDIVDIKVSDNEFKAAMYKVIADFEKQTQQSKKILQEMGIVSGDINSVLKGQKVNLAPLFRLLKKELE